MRALRSNRWALSFADLSLLMLGFLSLIHVQPKNEQSADQDNIIEDAIVAQQEIPAAQLFASGEAMLHPEGMELIAEISGQWSKWIDPSDVVVVSIGGIPEHSSRLEAWELSAARLASVGRTLKGDGSLQQKVKLGVIDLEAEPARQNIRLKIAKQK